MNFNFDTMHIYTNCVATTCCIVVRPVFLFHCTFIDRILSLSLYRKAQRSNGTCAYHSSRKYKWARTIEKMEQNCGKLEKKFFVKAQPHITKCVCNFTAARLQSVRIWRCMILHFVGLCTSIENLMSTGVKKLSINGNRLHYPFCNLNFNVHCTHTAF